MFKEMLQTRFGLGILQSLQLLKANTEESKSTSKSGKKTSKAASKTHDTKPPATTEGADVSSTDATAPTSALEGAPSVSEPSVGSLKRPGGEPSLAEGEPLSKKLRGGADGGGDDLGERRWFTGLLVEGIPVNMHRAYHNLQCCPFLTPLPVSTGPPTHTTINCRRAAWSRFAVPRLSIL